MAGTECGALRCQDHDPRGRISSDLVQSGSKMGEQFARKGVTLFRSVEREMQYPALGFQTQIG